MPRLVSNPRTRLKMILGSSSSHGRDGVITSPGSEHGGYIQVQEQ